MSIRRTTRAGIPRHYHESSHFLNTPLHTHKNQTTQKMRGIEISPTPPEYPTRELYYFAVCSETATPTELLLNQPEV